MKCKDCMHFELCDMDSAVYNFNFPETADDCSFFKDKSQYIKLPCKVGDTVYFIKSAFSFLPAPKSEKICRIIIYEDETMFKTENKSFSEKSINDIVFLTKEAAEKALREREEK